MNPGIAGIPDSTEKIENGCQNPTRRSKNYAHALPTGGQADRNVGVIRIWSAPDRLTYLPETRHSTHDGLN